MYHFDMTLDGRAVNEQWNDTAQMFTRAANMIEEQYQAVHAGIQLETTRGTTRRLHEAARLYELASMAYDHASAGTLGHGKTARYEQSAKDCRTKAIELYQQAFTTNSDYCRIPDWAMPV